MARNFDQKGLTGNTENTPLLSASSWADLNIDQDGNNETCNVQDFKDGNFTAIQT